MACVCGKEPHIRNKTLYRFKRSTGKGNSMIYYCSWTCYNKDRPESENCACTNCILGYRCYHVKRNRKEAVGE